MRFLLTPIARLPLALSDLALLGLALAVSADVGRFLHVNLISKAESILTTDVGFYLVAFSLLSSVTFLLSFVEIFIVNSSISSLQIKNKDLWKVVSGIIWKFNMENLEALTLIQISI